MWISNRSRSQLRFVMVLLYWTSKYVAQRNLTVINILAVEINYTLV